MSKVDEARKALVDEIEEYGWDSRNDGLDAEFGAMPGDSSTERALSAIDALIAAAREDERERIAADFDQRKEADLKAADSYIRGSLMRRDLVASALHWQTAAGFIRKDSL